MESNSKSEPTPPPPLPSGEHPWAASLRRWRKGLALGDLVVAIAITCALFLTDASLSWAISTQVRFESPWARALAYSALLAVIYGGAGLPFSLGGYVVEKKFGLSTQRFGAWLLDQLKGLLLGAVLGSLVVLGLTACLLWTGEHWWLSASAASVVFGVLLTRLAPQLLIPIFFKMKPLEAPDLVARFSALADRTGTPVLGIFEIDLSRRTTAANAAVVGFGGSRRALVGDTLLAKFSHDEIEFVLAHELGHHKFHDLWTGVATAAIVTTASLLCAHFAITHGAQNASEVFSMEGGFNPVLLFWIAVVAAVTETALRPLPRALSRFMETRADTFAAGATAKSRAGAAAFRKLGYQNLAVFRPPAWEEYLFHTHPCIARRISRLEGFDSSH